MIDINGIKKINEGLDSWDKNDEAVKSFIIIFENIHEQIQKYYDYHEVVEKEYNRMDCYGIRFIYDLDFHVNGVTGTCNEIIVCDGWVEFVYNFIDENHDEKYVSVEVDHEDFSDLVWYGEFE